MSSYSSADEEYDSDEPPELELNLCKLMDLAAGIFHTKCTSAKRLTRGSWHEIFALQFEEDAGISNKKLARSGYSCIARFARVRGASAKEESEIATIRYLKQHTSIPVPEIYYQDLNPDNDIGAAFVLMERLPGRHLYKTWDGLSLDQKKVALSEIASVIVQFASLRFDKIGCLFEGGIGPIISPCYDSPQGPFDSTVRYLQSFASPDSAKSPVLAALFERIQKELEDFTRQNSLPYLEPPFAMIHADFDAQNMLFSDSSDGLGPKLTGLIDFEYAHTGPVYYLYEYPIFIQDVSWSKELYAENVTLRAHFISQIFDRLKSHEARETFIACINGKSHLLNSFHESFQITPCSEDALVNSATHYLRALNDGTGRAYSGRVDYEPEYYTEKGELIAPKKVNAVKEASDESESL